MAEHKEKGGKVGEMGAFLAMKKKEKKWKEDIRKASSGRLECDAERERNG